MRIFNRNVALFSSVLRKCVCVAALRSSVKCLLFHGPEELVETGRYGSGVERIHHVRIIVSTIKPR